MAITLKKAEARCRLIIGKRMLLQVNPEALVGAKRAQALITQQRISEQIAECRQKLTSLADCKDQALEYADAWLAFGRADAMEELERQIGRYREHKAEKARLEALNAELKQAKAGTFQHRYDAGEVMGLGYHIYAQADTLDELVEKVEAQTKPGGLLAAGRRR